MRLNPTNINIIKRLLAGRNSRPLRSILIKVPPAERAGLFSYLNNNERYKLIDALFSADIASETLIEVPEQQLALLLEKLERSKVLALLKYSPEDQAAHFLNLLSEEERTELIQHLPPARQAKLNQILSYPEDSAGRLMSPEVFSLPMQLTVGEGLEILRTKAQEQSIYYIYCVDHERQLTGVISLRELATAQLNCGLEELIHRDVITVHPETSADEVARLVSRYGFIAIPVINQQQRLLGVITVDDVVDIIQEQVTANIYASAGLQEDDRVYSPAKQSFKNRLPWMLLNLVLAGLASSVISLFEKTMSELIILATLKNIVAGMGGNTAIQALTVVTRGIATDDFHYVNTRQAILKEFIVGCGIGAVTGVSAGVLVYLWKGSALVALVICLAMFLNSLLASLVGSLVPIALNKYGWDPAIGSGVIVTMATDIFGFFSFLGIASLALSFFAG